MTSSEARALGPIGVLTHAQSVYAEMGSYECGGPGEYFDGLRMHQ